MAKKTKAQERAEEYQRRVKITLTEANAAGEAAAKAQAGKMEKTSQGLVKDACGFGNITLYKPSYPLREALKALEVVTGNYGGGWLLMKSPAPTGSQSISVNEKAAQAACEIWKRDFPEEGQFYASSRMD